MVWDSLTEDDKKKFQEGVDDMVEKLLNDPEARAYFNITEEEAREQLAKRPKKQ